MIELRRRADGTPLRIGHRGAAALAPENTLRSFRAALGVGIDVIEFDLLDLRRGPLVLAHSNRLEEVSHGLASGSVQERSLGELRDLAPELPTLDEALAFFADEAPEVGLHIDLKLRSRFDELGAAVERFGVGDRTVVSAYDLASLRAVARHAPGVRIGFTYPEDRFEISRRQHLRPVVGLGLSAMRASLPLRLARLVRRAGATAVMLQHRLVTTEAVERAHAIGAPVLAWTVDDRADLSRVVAAGADGVITNDPRIFVATLPT